MAFTPTAVILFSRVAPLPSGFAVNTFPCHAKAWTNRAMSRLQKDPGQTMASPCAFPSGIGPAGLALKSSSSSALDLRFRSSKVMEGLERFHVFDQRALVGIGQRAAELVAPVRDQ